MTGPPKSRPTTKTCQANEFIPIREPRISILSHNLKRNPIYMGDFLWKRKLFHGKHTPLVSSDLFDRAHIAMGVSWRPKANKLNFAFTGMGRCGHCGASLTAEVKKGKYTYYRCAKQCANVVY